MYVCWRIAGGRAASAEDASRICPAADFRDHLVAKAAYGEDPTWLQPRLAAIAQALNSGDFTAAIIAAVHTRTPELSPEAALRLAKADEELTKYNFNPDELRDWHGRWTRDGAAGSADYAMGDDIMRSIVKNACIAECSESSLPTYNFGWKFFNCVNDYMRRHGYDPFVIRP